MQQHQREQAGRLGLVRHELGQDAGQADRLARELAPNERLARRGAVALVEDQVQDPEHTVEALREQLGRRHPVRDRGVADLPLRADEPLRERHLGHEEGARDLGRRQPAEGPQRERDARLRGERRDGST